MLCVYATYIVHVTGNGASKHIKRQKMVDCCGRVKRIIHSSMDYLRTEPLSYYFCHFLLHFVVSGWFAVTMLFGLFWWLMFNGAYRAAGKHLIVDHTYRCIGIRDCRYSQIFSAYKVSLYCLYVKMALH